MYAGVKLNLSMPLVHLVQLLHCCHCATKHELGPMIGLCSLQDEVGADVLLLLYCFGMIYEVGSNDGAPGGVQTHNPDSCKADVFLIACNNSGHFARGCCCLLRTSLQFCQQSHQYPCTPTL